MTRFADYGVGRVTAAEGDVVVSSGPPSSARRGAVFCHTVGNTAAQALASGYLGEFVAALADAGVPVIATDLGGLSTWGNDTAQSRIADARTRLGALGWKNDKVLLLAPSMGALAALNWARANPTLVAAVAGVIPVVDLQDVHDNNRGGNAAGIETAYGGAVAYGTARTAHNPAENAAAYAGLPIKLWYGTADATAIPGAVTTFAAASGAQTKAMPGNHDPTQASPSDVATWLRQYA